MPGQKWEYLTIQTESFGLSQDRIAVRYVNGQELRNWKNTPITDFLNRLATMVGRWQDHFNFGAFSALNARNETLWQHIWRLWQGQ